MPREKDVSSALSSYSCDSEVRVRFAETDKAGIVYYANYLVWFEVGRMGYFRSLSFSFKDFEAKGLSLAIVKATCDYHSPAYFDDLLAIRTRVTEIGRTSMGMSYHVIRKSDDKGLASGATTHVFVNVKGEPIPVPAWLVEAVMAKSKPSGLEG